MILLSLITIMINATQGGRVSSGDVRKMLQTQTNCNLQSERLSQSSLIFENTIHLTYRVSQKTQFLNLRVRGLPLPVGCLTGSGRPHTLKAGFAKRQFRNCVFLGTPCISLLIRHWYEIMSLYYVKSILTEISASRQDKKVLQKSKVIRINFFEHMGHATDVQIRLEIQKKKRF